MDQGQASSIGDWRPQANFHHDISNSEELERLNEVGAIAIDFRPFAHPVRSNLLLRGAQSRTFCCWTTNSASGFLSVPKHEADVITIRFVVDGRMIRRSGRAEHVGLPGLAMFVAFQEMRNEEASGNFASFGGTISREGLIRGHRALDGDDAPLPQLSPIASVSTLPMRAFAHSFTSLMKRLESGVDLDDHWLALLEEIIVYQLLTAWPKREGDRAASFPEAAASERMTRAVDFVEASLGKPIRLEDVARAAGVSVRTLQAGFQKSKGCSPTQYITRRRLEQVNEDLRATSRDELSISTAARTWGFSHMSDFSRQYLAHFGYLPRATPRRPCR